MLELTLFCIAIFVIFFIQEMTKILYTKYNYIKTVHQYTAQYLHHFPNFKKVYRIMKDLSGRAGISTPALRITRYTDEQIRVQIAYMGKNLSVVNFNDIITEQLTDDELEGAIAHELGHVCSDGYLFGRDFLLAFMRVSIYSSCSIATMGLVAVTILTVRGDISLVLSIILVTIFFSFSFLITHFAMRFLFYRTSRRDEFLADVYASDLLGGPDKIISALIKSFQIRLSSLRSCSESEVYWYFTSSSEKYPSIKSRLIALWKIKENNVIKF